METQKVLGEHVAFSDLNAKQKEIYNFQKVAGLLADYGFNCIKLADDWKGADFLADHFSADLSLRVQLKSCLTVDVKYAGKGLYMAFPVHGEWFLIPHDPLLDLVGELTNALNTDGWAKTGLFWTQTPNAQLRASLADYKLVAPAPAVESVPEASTAGSAKGVYVRVGREVLGPLSQKEAARTMVLRAVDLGGLAPSRIADVVGASVLRSLAGFLRGDELWDRFAESHAQTNPSHWFLDTPIYADGGTWVLQGNVWSKDKLTKVGVELEGLSGGTVGLDSAQ